MSLNIPDSKMEVWVRRIVVILTIVAMLCVVWAIVAPPRDEVEKNPDTASVTELVMPSVESAEAHIDQCSLGTHRHGVYLVVFRFRYEHPWKSIGRVHVVDVHDNRRASPARTFRLRRHVNCTVPRSPRILPSRLIPAVIPGQLRNVR